MASSTWEPGMMLVQELLGDTTELLRERKRAASLMMSLEPLDARIAASMARMRQCLAGEEQRLTEEEGKQNMPAAELRKWEQAMLDASQKADRLYEVYGHDGHTGQNGSTALSSKSRFAGASAIGSRSSVRKMAGYESFIQVADENEETNLANGELVQLQTRIIEQQDSHLDGLSETISRQKQLGQLISNELDVQVNLLEDTEQAVDNTHHRMNTANSRLGRILDDHESNSQGTCTIAILIVILIVVILVTRAF